MNLGGEGCEVEREITKMIEKPDERWWSGNACLCNGGERENRRVGERWGYNWGMGEWFSGHHQSPLRFVVDSDVEDETKLATEVTRGAEDDGWREEQAGEEERETSRENQREGVTGKRDRSERGIETGAGWRSLGARVSFCAPRFPRTALLLRSLGSEGPFNPPLIQPWALFPTLFRSFLPCTADRLLAAHTLFRWLAVQALPSRLKQDRDTKPARAKERGDCGRKRGRIEVRWRGMGLHDSSEREGGKDGGGTAEDFGPKVTHLKKGDRVELDPRKTFGSCYHCKSGTGRPELCPSIKFAATPPFNETDWTERFPKRRSDGGTALRGLQICEELVPLDSSHTRSRDARKTITIDIQEHRLAFANEYVGLEEFDPSEHCMEAEPVTASGRKCPSRVSSDKDPARMPAIDLVASTSLKAPVRTLTPRSDDSLLDAKGEDGEGTIKSVIDGWIRR
ncbi:hypothetical protein BT69DRAFT_1293673 [Atractiella rhizophila]|nr:hypothetical protein BT69DRAFT_1293673 [Atractiella rhizophila]